MSQNMNADQILAQRKKEVDHYLHHLFLQRNAVIFEDISEIRLIEPLQKLESAMAYAVLNGGKRMRATFTLEVADFLNIDIENVMPIAAAIECLHAYSLIHDDLPSMDDDALRRGKPTLHICFDEATAILAGDALQALAFELIVSHCAINADSRLLLVQNLVKAAGSQGMCLGQSLDLQHFQNTQNPLKGLQKVQALKTGEMIRFSILSAFDVYEEKTLAVHQALMTYADSIGFAFQIHDDILDITAPTHRLGKTSGKDKREDKPTATAILGIEQAVILRDELVQEAISALDSIRDIGDPSNLIALAELMTKREY